MASDTCLSEENKFARVREAHSQEIAEDYVELVYELGKLSGRVRSIDISQCLGVSRATVTRAMDRLRSAGLVCSGRYQAIELTSAGKELAVTCAARHSTVHEFLLALGVGSSAAEQDAEGIEHHVGDETLQAMSKFVASHRKRTSGSSA